MPSISDTPGSTDPASPILVIAVTDVDGSNAKLEDSILFGNFSLSVPAGNDVVGIEIVVTAAFSPSAVSGAENDCIQIALDGRTFTDALSPNEDFPSLTDGVAARTFGGSSNLLGFGSAQITQAIASEFGNTVIKYIHPSGADIFHVDQLKLVIHYQQKPGAPIQIISGRVQLINGRISI